MITATARGLFQEGAYQKMSGLISDEQISLTLTLSRWEREQPLDAPGMTNGHPASAVTDHDREGAQFPLSQRERAG
jgi:hypothetical protein